MKIICKNHFLQSAELCLNYNYIDKFDFILSNEEIR